MTRWVPLLLLLLSLVACGDAGPDPAAWVAEAEAAHARADAAAAGGDLQAAHDELSRFVHGEVPIAMADADRRVVRQDVHWRLAELALEMGEPQRAIRHANQGLAEAEGRPAVDVFTANLLVARGRAREAANDPLGAASDYHDALRIHDALLHALLDAEENR